MQILLLLLLSCNIPTNNNRFDSKNLQKLTSNFRSDLVNQFPKFIYHHKDEDYENAKVSLGDNEKHNVGAYFYEYNADKSYIDSIEILSKGRALASYFATDTCLLIVNRFETRATMDSFAVPEITDSSLLYKECYSNKLPIPNFLDYLDGKINRSILDSSFVIYVFGAKKGDDFYNEQLLPYAQMPKEWRNGYSKGIAISREKRTVIYWTVIW